MIGEIGNPGHNNQTLSGWGWSNIAWPCSQVESGETDGAGKSSTSYVRLKRSQKINETIFKSQNKGKIK